MMPSESKAKKQGRGINLFKIAGIQISIDFSWFIIFALIFWSLSFGYFPKNFPEQSSLAYWTAGLVSTLLFFLSVVIHELSHSLMAIRLGIRISEITLFIFGGISKLSEEAKDPGDEFKIAIVGPLSSFALAAVFGGIVVFLKTLNLPSLMVAVFTYLAWINVVLGVFNLIPGFPLDGGRVLRALLWWKTGSLSQATKWTSDMGKGFAVALMILGALQIFGGNLLSGVWFIFIGIFLRWVAEGGYQEVMIRQALEGVRVQEVMISEVVSVPPDLPLNQLISSYFLRYGFKGFPVMRSGEVLGVVGVTDVKDIPEDEQKSKTVQDIMTPKSGLVCITPELSLAAALKRMAQEEVGRLLVMQGDRLIGMITKTGLLRFIEIKRVLEK